MALHDLGQARQAWASRLAFGILGGRGDRGAIRQRIAEAKVELTSVSNDDYTRDKIKERIGKLGGTAVVLHVGAASVSEQEDLKLRVEAAVRAARCALESGVVPGGGAALLACAPALAALETTDDERAGVEALPPSPRRADALHPAQRWPRPRADPAPGVRPARSAPSTSCVKRGAMTWSIRWQSFRRRSKPAISAAATALTADVLVRRKDQSPTISP